MNDDPDVAKIARAFLESRADIAYRRCAFWDGGRLHGSFVTPGNGRFLTDERVRETIRDFLAPARPNKTRVESVFRALKAAADGG